MTKIECVIENKEIYVSFLRKTKKRYYENLNQKSMVKKKTILQECKSFDKVSRKGDTNLIKNKKLVKTYLETAEVLNNFFSNIVQNLDFPDIQMIKLM